MCVGECQHLSIQKRASFGPKTFILFDLTTKDGMLLLFLFLYLNTFSNQRLVIRIFVKLVCIHISNTARSGVCVLGT
jgi:hypothetical protein